MAITWNALAEEPTNSDQDVLMNIKFSNPCNASEFFLMGQTVNEGQTVVMKGGLANCA